MKKKIQDESGYESFEDALRVCIIKSGYSIERVARELWPYHKNEHYAYKKLWDALHEKRSQKLELEEYIFIMNFCKCYDPLYYMCDATLHERPEPISLEIETETLKETLLKTAQEFNKKVFDLADKLEKREEIEKIQRGKSNVVEIEKSTG